MSGNSIWFCAETDFFLAKGIGLTYCRIKCCDYSG